MLLGALLLAAALAGAAAQAPLPEAALGPVPEAGAPITGLVRVRGGRFEVDGRPWTAVGANIYYLAATAADFGGARARAAAAIADAAALGLNVLRTAAHGEGPDLWMAMQPAPGQSNETVFRNGLDYVVDAACRAGMRTLLQLTNHWPAGGGASTYVNWTGGTQLSDFYTQEGPKSLYKRYVAAVVGRRNSISGRLYSEDPCILGWNLANEPANRGDDSGDVLQAWLEEMSSYLRSLDPNHLIGAGLQGYFGGSTPELLKYNPPSANVYSGGLVGYNALCEGADFVRNHRIANIDFATSHLWPDPWWACSDECKIDSVRQLLRAQLDAAAGLGKPLVVEEMGKARPVAGRNAFFRMVFDELGAARAAGKPVGGSLIWMMADADYPDYDGSTVYTSLAPYQTQPSVPFTQPLPLSQAAMDAARFAKFNNYDAFVACLGRHTNGSADWNAGWQDTLALLRAQAAAA